MKCTYSTPVHFLNCPSLLGLYFPRPELFLSCVNLWLEGYFTHELHHPLGYRNLAKGAFILVPFLPLHFSEAEQPKLSFPTPVSPNHGAKRVRKVDGSWQQWRPLSGNVRMQSGWVTSMSCMKSAVIGLPWLGGSHSLAVYFKHSFLRNSSP
jgi:hypothetical protein